MGEGVVEGEFVGFESQFFTSLFGRLNILAHGDQFLDDIRDADYLIFVAAEGVFQHFGELATPDNVGAALGFDLVAQEFFEQFDGEVLVFHAFDFFEEFVGDDGEVGVFDACFVEDVDHGIGDEGLIDDLPNGGFDFGVAEATVGGFELAETGLDRLEKGDSFGLGDRFWVVGGQGIDFGEGGDGIEEAVFDLGVGDVVGGGFEQVEFFACGGGEVGLIVEARNNVFNDFEFGQQ